MSLRHVAAAILLAATATAAPGALGDDEPLYPEWSHQLHDCRNDWGPDSSGTPSAAGHDLVGADVREGPIPNASGEGVGVRLTMEGGFDGEPGDNETIAEIVNLTVETDGDTREVGILVATSDNQGFVVRSNPFPDQIVQRVNVTDDHFYVAAWYNHHRLGAENGSRVVVENVTGFHVDEDGNPHRRDFMVGGYHDPNTGSRVQGCPTPTDDQRYEDEQGYLVQASPGPPPVANFTVEPAHPEPGEPVQFTDRSTDPNDAVEQREWFFGDGTNATGATVNHTYDEPGTYRVTLVVTDAEGNRNATRERLEVQPAGPDASFTVEPEPATPGETVHLNATTPSTFNGSHHWTLGDGTQASGPRVTHTYDEPGTYRVRLNVTDEEGRSAETARNVTVVAAGNRTDANGTADDANDTPGGPANRSPDDGEANQPPRARIAAPQRATAGQPVPFQAEATDPDGQVVSREWDLGDGSTRTGATVNHSYRDPGRYNVTLTVRDDDGSRAQARHAIVVSPNATTEEGTGDDAREPGNASNATDGARPTPGAPLVAVLAGLAAAGVRRRR